VVVDDLGRNVTIARPPERIVSLIPSATQIVFAVGQGDKVVGVTRYDDYPPELVDRARNGTVQVVGGGLDPDVEKIILLNPDLILADGPAFVASQAISKLETSGFPVLRLDSSTIEGVLRDLRLVGTILRASNQAEQVAAGIERDVAYVTNTTRNAPRVRVYIENWNNPLYTVGNSTLQDEMLKLAGGVNIFSDLKGSVEVTPEAVIARNPDVIINFNILSDAAQIKTRPGWDKINAVRNNKVFQMNPEEAAPNPRVGQSLIKMATLIHPELFRQSQSSSSLAQIITATRRPY